MKHLKKYLTFIYEQDMMGMEGDPNAQPQAPKEGRYKFIFIEDGSAGDHVYPNGTSSSQYQSYEISESDLKKWLDSNIISKKEEDIADSALKIKRDNVYKYISGEKSAVPPDSSKYLDTFSNQVKGGQTGEKMKEIEVTFYKNDDIGTDEIDITFITIPKKK